MQEQTIAIYCVCEEIVRFFGLVDDSQCKVTTSEEMAFLLQPMRYIRAFDVLARKTDVSINIIIKLEGYETFLAGRQKEVIFILPQTHAEEEKIFC